MASFSSIAGKVKEALGLGNTPPKVSITAYSKPNMQGEVGSIVLPLVSIETLEQKYAIKWNGGENGGAQGQSAPLVFFQGYDTQVGGLTIDTIVDATGVYRVADAAKGDATFLKSLGNTKTLINYDSPDIEPYIKELKKLVYDFNAETHRPNYLELTWGKIFGSAIPSHSSTSGVFKCVLKEMTVTYELFSVTGTPVRAKVKLDFMPYTPPGQAETKNSPDLTHIIEIKAGDTLPKLCNDIYESTEYYHQVAQINKLPSAFALKPGMKLLFPPLDKFHR